MFTNRTMVAALSITVFSACHGVVANAGSGAAQQQAAKSGGPVLGKWEFTGKDNTGLAWTGTLAIEKLDTNRFDVNKYHSLCSLEVQSADPSKGTNGVEAPCSYDPGTRAVSFSTGISTIHSYTAVLSSDSRSLTLGKWTDSKKGARQSDRTGDWSAKLRQ
ncbi:MAG: hypothetical protein NTW28_36165 [Candidatus Solibacter sp.]|nr:hypothetical protein [Candidatus Solibacter sp.]